MMTLRRHLTLSALAAAAMPGLRGDAVAHPHMWVEMTSTRFLFTADGKVSGVAVTWTMDEGYSADAVDGMDSDGDGIYSKDELEPLTNENLESLKTYNYFIYFRYGKHALPIGTATDASQDFADSKLTLRFTVPLQTPVDPASGTLSLKIYDPDFFIEFAYAGSQPVSAAGAPPQCAPQLKPVEATTEVAMTREMLSTKDKDWKPEADEDFGSLFAQAVVIACS